MTAFITWVAIQRVHAPKSYFNKNETVLVASNVLIHVIPIVVGEIIVHEWRVLGHILFGTVRPQSVRIRYRMHIYNVGGMVPGKRHL